MIGKDTEKQTKTKTKTEKKNQDDKNWRLLLTAVDIICDNECI